MMFTDNLQKAIEQIKSSDKTMAHSVIENIKSIDGVNLNIDN